MLKNISLENEFNHTAWLRRRVFLVTTPSGVAAEDLTESNRVGCSWIIICPFARSDPFDLPSMNALCTKNACRIEFFTRPFATPSVSAPRPPMRVPALHSSREGPRPAPGPRWWGAVEKRYASFRRTARSATPAMRMQKYPNTVHRVSGARRGPARMRGSFSPQPPSPATWGVGSQRGPREGWWSGLSGGRSGLGWDSLGFSDWAIFLDKT